MRWLYEAGIGEERAILVSNGKIIEARIERHGGIKAGAVMQAKLVKKLAGSKRAIITLTESGKDAILHGVPNALTEGQMLRVVIAREAVSEQGRTKWPLAKATEADVTDAPTLLQSIEASALPVQNCQAHEADHFRDAGWHEVMEEARSGVVSFSGGSLLIAVTPAMTLIDIDGELPSAHLALVGAEQAALAIRRLGLQGSIGIDFPDAGGKAERQKVADQFDAVMTGDFERTAVNGFGLMQIVTRRTRPSLVELQQRKRMTGHALELLRQAERSKQAGNVTISAHPAIISKIEKRQNWRAELEKRTGRRLHLRADPKLAIGGGYAG
jgi:Ribonuclease G/E